jgi:hypothetical protein
MVKVRVATYLSSLHGSTPLSGTSLSASGREDFSRVHFYEIARLKTRESPSR